MAKGLLILKVNLFATNRDMEEIRNFVASQIETGLLILPPYLDPMVVPDDLEVRIEPFNKSNEGEVQ